MDLERTVERIAPGLLRYCAGASGSAIAGEEIAQEALTALVARWRREGPPDSPEAFAYVVARRAVRRRRWRRRLFRSIDGAPDATDPGPVPEEVARWRSELGRVATTLGRLPHRERDALLLSAVGDLDTAEAANVLGISRSAFKMRVHRARHRLNRLLEVEHGTRQHEAGRRIAARVR